MKPSGQRLSTNLLGLSLALAAGLALGTKANAQLKWESSFGSAIKKARAANKPIFVDFHAEWCGPCKMLEQNVFTDARAKALLQHATCLSIDIDHDQDDAQRYHVNSIPRLLLLTPNGNGVLWDTTGYREPDEFVQELSQALKVKAPVNALSSASLAPSLVAVKAALLNGSFGSLKAKKPAVAKDGLRLLVLKLGGFDEVDYKSAAALLQRAGRDAVPALLNGMAHQYLAVRVGSYRLIQSMLPKPELQGLTFNPWAPASVRASQLAQWQRLKT